MKTYQLENLRTRYIVPFYYNTSVMSYEAMCSNIDNYVDYPTSIFGKKNSGKEYTWIRESLREGAQDVYSYIIEEFSYTDDIDPNKKIEKSGCYWHYNSLTAEPIELLFKMDEEEMSYAKLTISDMGLYVFRSGVGLLWYELTPQDDAISDSGTLIRFQNRVKLLNSKGYPLLHVLTDELCDVEGMFSADIIPFSMGNWIANRLAFLDVKYQIKSKNVYSEVLSEYILDSVPVKVDLPSECPMRAILFTYAAFAQDEDWKCDTDVKKTSYYLTNGYAESFEISAIESNLIMQPFGNVIWSASKEGCGYYAWASDDNQSFFGNVMKSKIMDDYFILYIKAIYQSYTFLRYSISLSEDLPNTLSEYVSVSDKTELLFEQISSIRTEINLCMVKSLTISVSYIQHQNEFYGYVCERLKIREDAESVTVGLNALEALQKENIHKKRELIEKKNQEEREKNEQREKQADNTFQIGLGLMTFLVVISAITDAYGIFESLANNNLPIGWFIGFVIVAVLCIIVLVASMFIFIKSARSLRKR